MIKLAKFTLPKKINWRLLSYLFVLSLCQPVAAETPQTIRLVVPVVALLDIEDISPSFTFGAPTNAGDGLTVSATDNVFTIALTSNIPNADLNIKVGQDLTPLGIGLRISGTSLGSCDREMILTATDQTYCSIGTTITGTTSLPTMEINAAADSHGMAAYGDYSVDVTYTLVEN